MKKLVEWGTMPGDYCLAALAPGEKADPPKEVEGASATDPSLFFSEGKSWTRTLSSHRSQVLVIPAYHIYSNNVTER
ncbi:hypothetical protein E4T56_gene16832 [Termitomyces sp. T112]|nr:hypothetical protein E4T56_gene16832 [Termitomyces sp. T112]